MLKFFSTIHSSHLNRSMVGLKLASMVRFLRHGQDLNRSMVGLKLVDR